MRPLLAALLCSLVATCGQKGPLTPPGEQHARSAPAAADAGPRSVSPPASRPAG